MFGNQVNVGFTESIGSPVFSFSKYLLCITTSKRGLHFCSAYLGLVFLCAFCANGCSTQYICKLSFQQTFLAICHSRRLFRQIVVLNNSFSKLSFEIAFLKLVPQNVLAKEFRPPVLKIKDHGDHSQGTKDTLGGPKKVEVFVILIRGTKLM